MLLLGLDIGSSSVKASVIDASTGTCLGSSFFPKKEMEIKAIKPGWAEQDPEQWWKNLKMAVKEVLAVPEVNAAHIGAIGISYQMHGLVLIDKNKNVIRPSIIWCDSRAVEIGDSAFEKLGKDKCLSHLLNSPGNFTASKLKWVKDNEPEIFAKVWKMMLPGDYIAMKLTGNVNTTSAGLSEGIMWDFKENKTADFLLSYYGIPKAMMPDLTEVFGDQGEVSAQAAEELGIRPGVKVTYRAGDQSNNACSLNVLEPGQIAATAGTSGVVYGVTEEVRYDPQSRVNIFAHVNHTARNARMGVLLCISGTGILNSWLKNNVAANLSYEEMNTLASKILIGSEGLAVMPFGNGAERVLGNKEPGSAFYNLNFNIHRQGHIFRASQEGIAFSFQYGLEVMNNIGVLTKTIRAGKSNMFQSRVFRETLAGVTGTVIELYDTDGAQGAARSAGVGAGYYKNFQEAFCGLHKVATIEPEFAKRQQFADAYGNWRHYLDQLFLDKTI
jgi:xylulokinase